MSIWKLDQVARKGSFCRILRNHGPEGGVGHRDLGFSYFRLMVILAFWRNPLRYS